MSKRHNYFRPQPQRIDELAQSYFMGERLSKADFGVRESWKKLPKWQETWLVNHHQDWFNALENISSMLKVGEYE